jgi:hypothetical protein
MIIKRGEKEEGEEEDAIFKNKNETIIYCQNAFE